MPKYIVSTTWNGEGYSYSNRAELKEFKSDADAQEYIVQTFKATEDVDRYEVDIVDGCITFDDGEDQGTYQWVKAHEDTYGVVIRCNVNEVRVVDKDAWEEELDEAISQADPDDLDPDVMTDPAPFIGAYEGDYDYQFIKLKN